MGWARLTEADGFALAMLAVITTSLGILFLLFLSMLRSASKRDSQVDALLHELETRERRKEKAPETQPPPPAGAKPPPPPQEPWERDSDWWKDG